MDDDFFTELLWRITQNGLVGIVGLGAILLGVILICAAPYMVASRRRLLGLIGIAVILGLGGYVAYDRHHIILNLSLRDMEAVRQTCADLLQRHESDGPDSRRVLRGSEIPAPLTRLGAQFVEVKRDVVGISFVKEDGLTGSWWGLLYDPKQVHPPDNLGLIRATWYRQFYRIHVMGE